MITMIQEFIGLFESNSDNWNRFFCSNHKIRDILSQFGRQRVSVLTLCHIVYTQLLQAWHTYNNVNTAII